MKCWACPILDAGNRCDDLSAERTDAAAVGDWARFAALDAELRGVLAGRFPVPCGCTKPLLAAWLDLLAATLARHAKEARR